MKGIAKHFFAWSRFKEKDPKKALEVLTEFAESGRWREIGLACDSAVWSWNEQGVTFYYREAA